jgi:hypothetical protein
MWMHKLFKGVLRILTPLGPRYVRPTFAQRVYLLWIFRHFQTLPVKVLNSRQTRLVDAICSGQKFVTIRAEDFAILGTLEERPPVNPQELPPRRPSSSVVDSVQAFAANLRQRS